ncbi:MAG: hypothetical protein OEV30_05435 [Ignavibacteria bacterium]|nr:hypothetical protein [Ignavibacteria bacterium]
MLKRVATTLVVVALVGGTALADAKMGGVARQLSMGGAGARGLAVNPFIWDDATQMYINPAFGSMYKDYAWINVGGGGLTGVTTTNDGYGLQHGGMNFSLGNNLTVGTILSHDGTSANTVAGAIAPGGFGINTGLPVTPVEVLQAMASYGINNNTSLGLRVLYGWTSNDAINTPATGTNEFTASVIGATAGIHVNLGSGNAIEGSVSFASSTADDKAGQGTTALNATASGTEIGATVRAKLKVNNKVNFIPTAAFISASGDGSNGAATPTTADVTGTALGIGAGLDLTVGDFYMAGGVSYGMVSQETTNSTGGTSTTTKNTNTGFPIIQVGGEWAFVDWLTGRAGYIRSFTTFTTENTAGGVTSETNWFQGGSTVILGSYNANNLVVFGLAAAFGNFSLEATVSESVLRRGFGVIGSQDNLNSFGYVTTTYNID